MNSFIIQLFREIEARGIQYCHFKSNNNLAQALSGVDDLDLLISAADTHAFCALLAEREFRLATDRALSNPFVFHYYGLDPETGLLVHLHVYFRMITGGSILKNHWIPVERMLLEESGPYGEADVRTPSREADLVLFVIRKFIEQPSLIEHFLFIRDWPNVKAELNWLTSAINRERVTELVQRWLPVLPVELFEQCLEALISDAGPVRRVRLGIRMRGCFRHTVMPGWQASFLRARSFLLAYLRAKLHLGRKDRILFPGGRLVAFVGPEACGKTTLSVDTAEWLGHHFDVAHIHLGKPPKSFRTKGIWLAIRLYSWLKSMIPPRQLSASNRAGTVSLRADFEPNPIVAWLDSIDRYRWLSVHVQRMLTGTIVVTDRYPALTPGGLDGPRIPETSRILRLLSHWERRNYAKLPWPDVVFRVGAPLETTLKRNAERTHPEPEKFVRLRYEKMSIFDSWGTRVVDIDTTKPIEETIRTVRAEVWECMRGVSDMSTQTDEVHRRA